jgi:UDP-galactopyranose mutase
MWVIELEALDAQIIRRAPVRDGMNAYYFPNNTFQALPQAGYTRLVENMLDHASINILLHCPYSLYERRRAPKQWSLYLSALHAQDVSDA